MKLHKTLIACLVLFFTWSCASEKVIISEKKGTIIEDTCSAGDCQEGHGTWIYKQGDTYTGFWKSGKRHGRGTMTWYSVSQYDGVDRKTEKGKYYQGRFKMSFHSTQHHPIEIIPIVLLSMDNIIGQIKMSIKESRASKSTEIVLRYSGSWKNGMLHGYGTLFLPNGKKIRGYWKNNSFEGEK